MAIPDQLTTLERQKFEECTAGDGKVAVRTKICSGQVDAIVAGLNEGGKITHDTANAVAWKPAPATALVNRNSLSIINRSETTTMYYEYDNTQPVGVGFPLSPGQAVFKEITEDILIYVSTASGTAAFTTDETA